MSSKKKLRKEFLKEYRKSLSTIDSQLCPCGGEIAFSQRSFKDGTQHIEMRCSQCNIFLGWAKQTPQILDKIIETTR